MDTNLIKQLLGHESGNTFSQVTIGLASPEVITSWSRGEVKNPETINYRTFKPEKGGLFCERIFGPTKDWECSCGKYKRVKHKGIVCDRCGVEVTRARVRRERMGHIDLAVPVSHIWFFKCMPSRLGMVLDMTAKNLEHVIYYEKFIVTDPGDTPLQAKQLLTDQEYKEALDAYGSAFKAGMGAAALKDLLGKTDPEALLEQLRAEMAVTRSKANHKKIAKRMRIMEGFIANKAQPEWMVIETLPVIPPDLRPLVPLEGGRFATSDLNDLYRRVINRNNRLKNLLHLRTPEVIVRNEKRMLQEAVDALMDNGRHGRAVTGANNRQLKSLSDMLKGKQGRFRQNLLGKRVDYSGRSVIVVGPELKLHQCGLPKKMAMTLFEPFIIRRLKEMGVVHTVRAAKKMIERGAIEVWDVLEQVTQGHPVLLNRAPTLHRLSIQAFDPILIEGKAIRVHPLVCAAFNADFDGDQMAVHVPLSNEAQLEAKLLMLSPNNILSPASGKPVCTPTQDMILGCYYLAYLPKVKEEEAKKHRAFESIIRRRVAGEKLSADDAKMAEDFRAEHSKLKAFATLEEIFWALENKSVALHDLIRFKNPDQGNKSTLWGDKDARNVITTPGRVIFRQVWPEELGFLNRAVTKKSLQNIIGETFETVGRDKTVDMLDRLKKLGFEYATKSGFSVATADMIIPTEKNGFIRDAQAEVEKIRKQHKAGVITNQERYNRMIDVWTKANTSVAQVLFKTIETNNGLKEINSIFAMMDSGARGSKDQIRQLAGMRGLMAKPSGEIIERPIISNFREGLSVLEYFISSHGARKGLADTALKTADSGYMTRKLVDVSQDVVISEEDCGTTKGLKLKAIRAGNDEKVSLADRVIGRFSLENIHNPLGKREEFIVRSGEMVSKQAARRIAEFEIEEIRIRSGLTCESKRGVCAKCYGVLLANGEIAKKGDAVGIIAAQSIGEPGTQLTMRTFHVGGTASTAFTDPKVKIKRPGHLVFVDVRAVRAEDGNLIVLSKNGKVAVANTDGTFAEEHSLVPGAFLHFEEGAVVKAGDVVAEWDPYNIPIIAEFGGKVEFRDLVEGVTLKREINAATGAEEIVVLEHRDDLHPQIVILDKSGEIVAHSNMPAGAHIVVKEDKSIKAGIILAKIPRQSAKTKDITGGLPRVAELFEARKPKDPAVLAPIDGVIEITRKLVKGKQQIIVRDLENSVTEEVQVPASKRLVVSNGESVRKGTPITDGAPVLQDLLDICGAQMLQEYLVNEVQEVYRLQGVEINDKHIEIVVRQMLRKVRIGDSGTTRFLTGEQIDRRDFDDENEKVIGEGGQPAEGVPVLLGITKASLETESFISAASFQDTTRILTDAATLGKADTLRGFKENVIMGHLIPAGTGIEEARNIRVLRELPDNPPEDFVAVSNEAASAEEENDEALKMAKSMLALD